MASKCSRIVSRSTMSCLKSAFKKSSPTTSFPSFAKAKPTSSAVRRFSLSRVPSELGAVHSLMPLHSAVATARMTSCLSSTAIGCRALSQGTLCCTSPSL